MHYFHGTVKDLMSFYIVLWESRSYRFPLVLFSNLSRCVTSTHTLLMIVSHFLYMHIVLLIKISNLSQLAEKD